MISSSVWFWSYAYALCGLTVFAWCWYASYVSGQEDGDDFEDNMFYSTLVAAVAGFFWFLVVAVILILVVAAFLDIYLPGRRGARPMGDFDTGED